MVGESVAEDDALLNKIWKRTYPDIDFFSLYHAYDVTIDIDSTELLFKDIPGLLEMLSLRNIRMAIASNSPRSDVEKFLNDCGLVKYFEYILSGEDVKRSKPASDCYKKLLMDMGLYPKECLVFEDSTLGIEATEAAGIYTVARKCNYEMVDQSRADKILDDARKILEYI